MFVFDKLAQFLLTEERMGRMGLRHETQEDLDALLPVIEFLCEPQHRLVMREPEPAMKNIADWWKKIPANLPNEPRTPRDHFGMPVMTAKKCIPLLDGMALGYTMVTAVDIHVRTDRDGKFMDIKCGPTWNGASTHDIIQLGERTSPTYPGPAIKFHNPWVIKTRPGYSTLFVPPLNHVEEKRFQCLAAVVDTDTYPKQVNFPAIWFAKGHDGLIPAGTPLVTAIPFKRSDVPKELLIRTMHERERQHIAMLERVQGARSHVYTDELREDRKKFAEAKCPMGHHDTTALPANEPITIGTSGVLEIKDLT
jgi:hypothetical protein